MYAAASRANFRIFRRRCGGEANKTKKERKTQHGKQEKQEVYAFGIPGIAVISQTTQAADNKGEDTNVPVQVNPVTTKP